MKNQNFSKPVQWKEIAGLFIVPAIALIALLIIIYFRI